MTGDQTQAPHIRSTESQNWTTREFPVSSFQILDDTTLEIAQPHFHHSVLVQAVTKPTSSSSFKGRRESLCLLMEELQGSRKTRGTRQVYVTIFSSVQSLSHVQSSRPYGLQHPRPPCPSPTPGACSNSCPWSR